MLASFSDSPWMTCPHCGHWDLHYMREPNPEPPVVTISAEEQDEIIQRTFDGRIAVHVIPMDIYDHDDERDFYLIRICTRQKCNKPWGVIASTEKE